MEVWPHNYLGCSICFRTSSINGCMISSVKDSLLSIAGTCVEQKNGTRALYTVQGRDTLLLPGVIHPSTYRPETYENGRKSCVSRRRLLHCKTKRSVHFYFIVIWAHSHSAHRQGFEQYFLAMGEHSFVEPEHWGHQKPDALMRNAIAAFQICDLFGDLFRCVWLLLYFLSSEWVSCVKTSKIWVHFSTGRCCRIRPPISRLGHVAYNHNIRMRMRQRWPVEKCTSDLGGLPRRLLMTPTLLVLWSCACLSQNVSVPK